LEDSQIASAERLVKLAAVATKAACIDIQLTQERDGKDQAPASNVFTEAEIDTIAVLNPTLEGNTDRQRNSHPPGSLAWAAWCIARLGGWNCYYKVSDLLPPPWRDRGLCADGLVWMASTRQSIRMVRKGAVIRVVI